MTSLSPTHQSVADFVGRWYLAQTRPRYEARLSSELRAAGVSHFLPIEQLERRKEARGRLFRVQAERPLFPGYVFVRGDWTARDAASRSIATTTVRDVADGMQDRLTRELLAFERAIEDRIPLGSVREFKGGQRVVVVEGPFMGSQGLFLRKENGGEFLLSLSILGAATPVQMPPQYVEPLN